MKNGSVVKDAAEKETTRGCPPLEKLLRCEVAERCEYRRIHCSRSVIQSICHAFTLPSPEVIELFYAMKNSKIKNESVNSMFLCCDGMQREGPRENSEGTSSESEAMKECSPCVEVQNPGQGPTRKCTKSIKRE